MANPIPIETKTVFRHVRSTATPKQIGRGKVISVIVRNPLTNSDGTGNTAIVFVGDGATQIYDLMPGQETPEIFTSDLKDVYVRTLSGGLTAATVDLVVVEHRDGQPVRLAGIGK